MYIFATNIFQGFCPTFKNIFCQEQLSLTATVSLLEPGWSDLLKRSPEEKHPCGFIVSIKLDHNSI